MLTIFQNTTENGGANILRIENLDSAVFNKNKRVKTKPGDVVFFHYTFFYKILFCRKPSLNIGKNLRKSKENSEAQRICSNKKLERKSG